MDKLHLLLFALAFLVIMVAVLASMRTRARARTTARMHAEGFVDGDSGTVDPNAASLAMVNSARSLLYNSNGMYNFYSSGEPGSLLYQNRANYDDFVSYLMAFQPSFMDDYCKPYNNMVTDATRCNNMFIDNVASPDQFFAAVSSRERACSTVMSSIGAAESNSMVRVLSAWYRIFKRCIRFDTISVSSLTLAGATQGYKVTVTGYLAAFVLSRPLFVSFGTYGLFQIVHSYPGSVFSTFNSNVDGEQFFVVQPVAKVGDSVMFPDDARSPPVVSLKNAAVPVTIYYLTYQSDIQTAQVQRGMAVSSDLSNVLTVVLSKEYLDGSVSSSNGAKDMTLVFPTSIISTPGITNSTSLSFSYSKSPTATAAEVASLEVRYGPSDTVIAIGVPAEFRNAVVALRQSNVRHGFHICITYAMDVIIVACYLRTDGASDTDAVYVSRQAVRSSSNDYAMLAYSAQDMRSSISYFAMDLNTEMAKYHEFATLTSIPNHAHVARYLGYTI